jgi:hypothetical protein
MDRSILQNSLLLQTHWDAVCVLFCGLLYRFELHLWRVSFIATEPLRHWCKNLWPVKDQQSELQQTLVYGKPCRSLKSYLGYGHDQVLAPAFSAPTTASGCLKLETTTTTAEMLVAYATNYLTLTMLDEAADVMAHRTPEPQEPGERGVQYQGELTSCAI